MRSFPSPAPLLLASLLCSAGCETDSSTPAVAGRQAGASPHGQAVPSANLSRLEAYKDASVLAARGQGRQALVGGGVSMNPVYGENTMLVVHPIAYQDLKVGMTVVYLSKAGHRVAHQLISKERGGWRAQGINNANQDAELVTPENLIGVVYASIVSEAP